MIGLFLYGIKEVYKEYKFACTLAFKYLKSLKRHAVYEPLILTYKEFFSLSLVI